MTEIPAETVSHPQELCPFHCDCQGAMAEMIRLKAINVDMLAVLKLLLIELGEGSARGRPIDLLSTTTINRLKETIAERRAVMTDATAAKTHTPGPWFITDEVSETKDFIVRRGNVGKRGKIKCDPL